MNHLPHFSLSLISPSHPLSLSLISLSIVPGLYSEGGGGADGRGSDVHREAVLRGDPA